MKTFNEQNFLKYRAEHPEMRFFQALRNFCNASIVWIEKEEGELKDTFYIKDERN